MVFLVFSNGYIISNATSKVVQKNNSMCTKMVNTTPKKQVLLKTKEEPLEDMCSVNFYLYAVDTNGKKIWEKSWKNIMQTELPVASSYTIWNNTVYIEVEGNLYAADLYTGAIKWKDVGVGATDAPVVDQDGTIYCSGFYGPDITAITQDGKIKWQHDSCDVDLCHPSEITLKDGLIYIGYDSIEEDKDCCVLDKNGKILKVTSMFFEQQQWDKVTASSTLEPSKKRYLPTYVTDDNYSTSWVEGKKGDGIGEWIKLESNELKEVFEICIANGYQETDRLYLANNRLKKIKIEFSDGSSMIKEIPDYNNSRSNVISLGKSTKTNFIKITILDVYKGTKYSDTCISEIKTY
jgi:hypothetical protein